MKALRPLAHALLLGTALMVAAPALTPAHAADEASGVIQPITLRQQSTIYGNRIHLGDIFDGTGPLANAVVGNAPGPGQRAVYDAAYLSRIAGAFRLVWQPTSMLDSAQIMRAGQVIGPDAIRGMVEAALAGDLEQIADGHSRTEIELDNRMLTLNLPQTAPDDVVTPDSALMLTDLNYDQLTGRFTGTLRSRISTSDMAPLQVSGRVIEMIKIPVFSHRIAAGELISPSDITAIEVRRTKALGDIVIDEKALIGLTPRHNQQPNQPIAARDVQPPTLVAKGAIVTMVLHTPTLSLSTKGRALQDGSAGASIQVMNITSNRAIVATVDGPNSVVVALAGETR